MGAATLIRDDIPAEELRRRARQESDGRVACRLLALANALDGMSRERAAGQAGMDRQTLRDWVIRFNAAGIEGLRDRPRSGRPPWLDEGQLAALKALVLRGPDPERDGVSSWRARISAGSSSNASASPTPRTACCGCSTTSTCPGRRPAPCIPRPIPRRRRASKKIPGADRRGRARSPRGRAARGLVPGRSAGRSDRARLSPLVPEGPAATRPARSAPPGGLSVRRGLPGA
jgi:Winged helix-turn helix